MAPTPKVTIGSPYGFSGCTDKNHNPVAPNAGSVSVVNFMDPWRLSAYTSSLYPLLPQSVINSMNTNDHLYAIRLALGGVV